MRAYYPTLFRIKKITADKIAAAGTVMTQAAMMVMKCDRRTNLRCLRFGVASLPASTKRISATLTLLWVKRQWASRKNPTPNTAPTAMWVEDTGSPNHDAMITVIAADKATQ